MHAAVVRAAVETVYLCQHRIRLYFVYGVVHVVANMLRRAHPVARERTGEQKQVANLGVCLIDDPVANLAHVFEAGPTMGGLHLVAELQNDYVLAVLPRLSKSVMKPLRPVSCRCTPCRSKAGRRPTFRTLKQLGHDAIRTTTDIVVAYLKTGELPPLPSTNFGSRNTQN